MASLDRFKKWLNSSYPAGNLIVALARLEYAKRGRNLDNAMAVEDVVEQLNRWTETELGKSGITRT